MEENLLIPLLTTISVDLIWKGICALCSFGKKIYEKRKK